MSNKVYLTFENCVRSHVTGVFVSEKLAEEAIFENEYLDYIECLEIKGYVDNTKEVVEDIISTIEKELDNFTYPDTYNCEDGTIINTDTDNINDWFNKYKEVLRRKYQ